MTVVGYLRERPAPVLPEVSGDRATAAGTVARDLGLKSRLARQVPPWCWRPC